MRILIMADVHANWEALTAVARVERAPAACLFAGDAVGWGADPDPCAAWLRANSTHAIAGDCDRALWDADELLDQANDCCAGPATITYAAQQLAAPQRDFLALLPETCLVTLDDTRFFLTHAGPAQLFDRADLLAAPQETLAAAFRPIPADVIVIGHTHKPGLRQVADKVIVAPGSVGQPRYGAPDATFAVWDSGTLKIQHVHYDHHAAAGKLAALPLAPRCRERLQAMLEHGM